MPIHPPDVPPASVHMIQETLRELLAIPGFVTEIVRSPTLGLPGVTTPHLVYGMTPEDIASGQDLEGAIPHGLRFLILEQANVIAGVELALDEAGVPTTVTNLFRGPSIIEFTEIVRRVEELDLVRAGSFELRLISIPPLNTLAVWLRNDGEGQDILVPISPAPAPLRSGEPHAPAEFLGVVREQAQRLVNLQDQVTT